MSNPAGVHTFLQHFPREPVLIDERIGISPHYLGIGKTRKLVDLGDRLLGFYSTGYALSWFVAERGTLEVTARGTLDEIGIAWGGGQFCVDHAGDDIHLVWNCRSRLHVFHRTGHVKAGRFELDGPPAGDRLVPSPGCVWPPGTSTR